VVEKCVTEKIKIGLLFLNVGENQNIFLKWIKLKRLSMTSVDILFFYVK